MFVRKQHQLVDEGAWRECCQDNCYRLGQLKTKEHVVDVGAHIGSFAMSAIARGAVNVHCYEADPRNFDKLAENVAPFPNWVKGYNRAVWRSDVPDTTLALDGFIDRDPNTNTGGGNVVSGKGKVRVQTIKLDDILRQLVSVQFLKLDCEGSEYPILYSSKELRRVDRIAAEVHGQYQFAPEAVVPGCIYDVYALAKFLLSKAGGDFSEVQIVPHKSFEFLALLWASRL